MRAPRPIHAARADKYSSLESRLSGILKPIPPRKEFVSDLSHRIQMNNKTTLVNHLANWHFLAMLLAGVISALVLLALGIRALMILTGKKRAVTG